MAADLTEVACDQGGKSPLRGVYLTTRARKEFEPFDAKTKSFLLTVMKQWAWAVSRNDEPKPKKFKRLGQFPSGNPAMPEVKICEFKRYGARVYGHEVPAGAGPGGRAAIILVLAEPDDKGGQAGKKQKRSIETAAKRAGELYD
ncbi:MAG: hypothetical protein ACOY3L_03595 [Pseudomonadota bacterium]